MDFFFFCFAYLQATIQTDISDFLVECIAFSSSLTFNMAALFSFRDMLVAVLFLFVHYIFIAQHR